MLYAATMKTIVVGLQMWCDVKDHLPNFVFLEDKIKVLTMLQYLTLDFTPEKKY